MLKVLEKHHKISLAVTILIAVAIFYISSIQFPSGGGAGTGTSSWAYHFFAFFFLSLFFSISCIRGDYRKRNLFLLVVIVSIAYGILDEFHQYFVPSRHMSLFDVAIDSLGILAASVIYFLGLRKGKSKSKIN